MCGVAAAVGWDAQEHVQRMVEHMSYRGTEPPRVWTYGLHYSRGAAAIGHVRLPIVGLGDVGRQPVELSDRQTLAFVGELLSFRDSDPNIPCDLHEVVRLWQERGPTGFADSDGFWSVVVFDEVSECLHLVVDYLAQKPLYYRTDHGIVAAASEPDAVAALAPVTPDAVYLASVIKWGYCPETWRTPYAEVRKTLPGEHVILNRSGLRSRAIVDSIQPRSFKGLDETRRELRWAIDRAVQRRVVADVPIAMLLSGGLDSSIVYRLARGHTDAIRVYHVENGEQDREAAEAVLPPGDRMETVRLESYLGVEAVSVLQEPIDLGSLVPQYALSRAVRQSSDARVVLTGDGADELFGGYGRSQRYDSQASDVWHELVAWHLPRLDRVMMRQQLEVRSPFLSRDVVSIALGLPRAERTGKKILRDLFRDDLPEGIADREKVPLRMDDVARDRETWSRFLVDWFVRDRWGSSLVHQVLVY